MIYIGTCGYSYRDWVGPFYPYKSKPSEMLPWYARRFSALEVNMSYYALPDRSLVASMDARTPAEFRFTFKAPQSVTHKPDPSFDAVHGDAKQLVANLEPVRASGKLACVLAQFPNGFRRDDIRMRYVRRVIEAFDPIPVAIEFRSGDWQDPEVLEMLAREGAAFSNVDLPQLESLPHPSSDVTAPIAYVRFHGRNTRTWWKGSNVTRYDYAYSETELEPWADRVAELEGEAKSTYVFFNNHARANAPQNAQTLRIMLEERYAEVAEEHIAVPQTLAPEQPSLPGL